MLYRLSLLLALVALLCTCDRGESFADASTASAPEASLDMDEMIEMEPPRAAEPPPPPPPPPDAMPQRAPTAPKVIYTAAARARVAQLDSALARVRSAVTAAGGYLSNQHRTNSAYEHAATLTVRLPADRLQPTLDLLPGLSEQIDYQNLDSRDVTAEWLDLESRLQTKRDVRDRYVDILRNRAQKVEDILNAEDKIRVITEEIEAKEGRLRYLRDQVSFSTLTLELYETQEYRDAGAAYRRSFGSKFVAALASGWQLIQEIVLLLLAGWPLLLLAAAGWWWWRRRRRAA